MTGKSEDLVKALRYLIDSIQTNHNIVNAIERGEQAISNWLRPHPPAEGKESEALKESEVVSALKRFVKNSPCKNSCKSDDMTCDTQFAKQALKNVGE